MQRRTFLVNSLALVMTLDKSNEAKKILTASGVSAATLLVTQGADSFSVAVGPGTKIETAFLLASITKPMTAAAVMVLADRGDLRLEDRVDRFIPEFRDGDRALVTVKHLLTHTSGLPDMLPENEELRRRHAPLADFVALTCRTPLLFKPGTRVKYQSMGYLLAAEIAERITRKPFREFIKEVVFDPLGMNSSSLGLGGRTISETARCEVSGNDDWNWNSPYWRDLGAPWGGAHAPAKDVAKFLGYFLKPDGRVVKRETAAQMVMNQNDGLNEPWEIGFSVKPASFGRGCSGATFGHYGSTGTLAWADPQKDMVFVLLTTRPVADSRAAPLAAISDFASEAPKE